MDELLNPEAFYIALQRREKKVQENGPAKMFAGRMFVNSLQSLRKTKAVRPKIKFSFFTNNSLYTQNRKAPSRADIL